jgi:hypothetical protein
MFQGQSVIFMDLYWKKIVQSLHYITQYTSYIPIHWIR